MRSRMCTRVITTVLYIAVSLGLWAQVPVNSANCVGEITSDPDVALNKPGGLVVFARGPDNGLWHTWQDQINGNWHPWESLGGSWTSGPAAELYRDGRLNVFVRGTDNAIWTRWQTTPNGNWSNWESIGGGDGGGEPEFGTFKADNWPAACWRPYADTSPFNTPIPPNPTVNPTARRRSSQPDLPMAPRIARLARFG
jgi:hypothetical protein